MERMVLIDGPSLLHRAYHALPPLTDPKGEQAGAVFGFTSMFFKVLEDLKPTLIVCAWDTAAPTFRDQLYTQYKAQRPPLEKDFLGQEPRAHKILDAFGVVQYSIDGFEADDIIGTLTKKFKSQISNFKTKSQNLKPEPTTYNLQPITYNQFEIIIVTGDMDSTQLIDENTKVYTLRKGFSDTMVYGIAEVLARYQLKPSQIIDYKALRGDPSDNIPGVRGIGEKTASELLGRFGTLTGVYEHLGEVSERQRKLLANDQEMAFLSQKLATIDQNVPLQADWEKMKFGEFDKEKILGLFQELGFRSLVGRLEKLGLEDEGQKIVADSQLRIFQSFPTTPTSLTEVLQLAKEKGELVLDTETTGYDPFHNDLVGIGLGVKDLRCFLTKEEFLANLEKLKAVLEDQQIGKIGHNLKFDAQFLLNLGIKISPFSFDTILSACLLQAGQGRLGLKELAFNKLGLVMEDLESAAGISRGRELGVRGKVGNVWTGVDTKKTAGYCLNDVEATTLLYRQDQKELIKEEKLERLLREVELPLSEILLEMERNGVLMDQNFLSKQNEQLQQEIAKREKDVFLAVGHEFNLNSPKQLDVILFDELRLPSYGRTKEKTHRSTDEGVLRKLKGMHLAIKPLLEYREAFKIKSTYIDPLLELKDEEGRIHTKFNQIRASTGRLSSEDPNLQNIPVAAKWSLRPAFVAPSGCKLLVADYSQIELRIMAHFSRDSALLNSFEHDQDIHTATAARIFDKFIGEVTPDERRIGKTVNFAVLYGQTAYGLAELLEIGTVQAQHFIDEYFASYPQVNVWIADNLKQAYETGYVETLLGRRRLIPELLASNFMVRAAGERMAVNMPIQGTAADLIKKAMVNINSKLKTQNLLSQKSIKSKLLLQVHDELVFEVPENQVGEIGLMVKEEMEKAMELVVPIKVELKTGNNWGELTRI